VSVGSTRALCGSGGGFDERSRELLHATTVKFKGLGTWLHKRMLKSVRPRVHDLEDPSILV
jgi:hypothetical protein